MNRNANFCEQKAIYKNNNMQRTQTPFDMKGRKINSVLLLFIAVLARTDVVLLLFIDIFEHVSIIMIFHAKANFG